MNQLSWGLKNCFRVIFFECELMETLILDDVKVKVRVKIEGEHYKETADVPGWVGGMTGHPRSTADR